MEAIYKASFSSVLGRITVRASDRGIREISLGNGRSTQKQGRSTADVKANGQTGRSGQWARQAVRELEEYAAGRRKAFTVPLDLDGTAFQKKVWKALLTIPYGQTRSYGQIARQVGIPRAARAVGMANHENPVAIVVPCHRVISSDGSLGGYAGGVQMKSQMLRLEQANCAPAR